jgi:transcriptional regulator with GAF, ATPase, and Fis domain
VEASGRCAPSAKGDLDKQHPKLKDKDKGKGIVGESQHIMDVCKLITTYAPEDLSVLIAGPTGSGKEVVAQAIHACSPRHNRPLVPLNCASIPESLFESEMFGHVKGAFTGAIALKHGVIEEADGGSLFLDEINKMSLKAQGAMLRVL